MEESFNLPTDIETWICQHEMEFLCKYAKGKRVLEIGSWHGYSTIALASVAEHVTSIDWHKGDVHIGKADTLRIFEDNLHRYGVDNKVSVIVDDSSLVVPLLKKTYSFIFIDGTHTKEAVRADSYNCLRVLEPGGYIAWHDYGRCEVTEVVDDLIQSNSVTFVELVDSTYLAKTNVL